MDFCENLRYNERYRKNDVSVADSYKREVVRGQAKW